jgi:hypothetical protein
MKPLTGAQKLVVTVAAALLAVVGSVAALCGAGASLFACSPGTPGVDAGALVKLALPLSACGVLVMLKARTLWRLRTGARGDQTLRRVAELARLLAELRDSRRSSRHHAGCSLDRGGDQIFGQSPSALMRAFSMAVTSSFMPYGLGKNTW